MQLNCPNCTQIVPAEHINIQEMVAVCPNCDAVFRVETPASKIKRRKVKQPAGLTLHDGDNLHMSFRTNWRLDRNENFIGALVGLGTMLFVSLVMTNEFLFDDAPLILPIIFWLTVLGALYGIGVMVYNATHIEMDDHKITISRKPLSTIIDQTREVSLADVKTIHCEETAASVQASYDTPRYNVWAETVSGARRSIVNDVTEDYGYFIAQRIEEHLHYDDHFDTAHLEDSADNVLIRDDETVSQIASQQ